MRSRFIGVAAAVLLLVGCGAVEDTPNLAEAVENTEAAESSRFEVHAVEGEREEVRIDCAGEADYERKLLEFSCKFGEGFELTTRAVDGRVYVRNSRASENWQSSPDQQDGASDFSPQRLLSMLRTASRETERLGDEDVRGVPADHYRLTVSCEEAKLSNCRGETTPVEVWIDEDDIVRRIWVQDGHLTGTIEFFDFGVPVDIQRPPAAELSESPVVAEETRPCDPDGGTPIRASRAIEALRRAGFSVRSDRDACFGDVVAAFDNTALPRVLEREGVVMCHLYDEPQDTVTTTVVRRGVDGGDAELVLANLKCLIFTDRPDPEPAIKRLEQAIRELER